MIRQFESSIKDYLDKLSQIKVEELLASTYGGDKLDNKKIQQLNVLEFFNLFKRVIAQFQEKFQDVESFIVLPANYNSQAYGNYDLNSCLVNFHSYIVNKQFPSAENTLLWLVEYQCSNGFWDRSKTKVHSIESLELKKVSDSISVLVAETKEANKSVVTLLGEVRKQKQTLEEFYIQKQQELQSIANNLVTANTNTNQIAALLNQSTTSSTKISSLLEQSEKEKKKIEEMVVSQDAIFTDKNEKLENRIKELDKLIKEFDNLYKDFEVKHEFVKDKQQYFEERNTYLNDLIGREVGASLFETFNQRKNELSGPLSIWRTTVGVMGVLSFVMVLATFTNFLGAIGPIEPSFTLEMVLGNFLKSLPFFFLLYYAISQYNKERNFQEEYAFKSAVALTIKAYADILKDEKHKDELVLKSVGNIFRSPMQLKSKLPKDYNSVLDIAQELVEKGTDVVKKVKQQ